MEARPSPRGRIHLSEPPEKGYHVRMRNPLIACSVALLIGCGSGGSSGNTDMGRDMTVSPDLTPQGPTWNTTVLDISTMKGLAGVNVCIYPGNTTCSMTNSSGTDILPVPEKSQFMLSYTLTNYVPAYTE